MREHSTIPELFDPMRYPEDPGYRPIDTSHEAAKKVRPKKEYFEQCVLDALADFGALTDEQIADITNEDFASIQPAAERNGAIPAPFGNYQPQLPRKSYD